MASVIVTVSTSTTAGQVAGSAVHNSRSGRFVMQNKTVVVNNAHNADPSLEHLNQYFGAKTPQEVLEAVKERLSVCTQKIEMNGQRQVMIEYLVSASRDFFLKQESDTASTEIDDVDMEKAEAYFHDARKYFVNLHGENNVVSIAVHFDELTPHMHLLAVPIIVKEVGVRDRSVIIGSDENGKRIYGIRQFKTPESVELSSRHFIGSREKLSQLQTDFYQEVGKKFGLARGVEGSKAEHQKIKKFYGALNAPLDLNNLEVVKAKAIDRDRAVERAEVLEHENSALRPKAEKIDRIERAIQLLQPEQKQIVTDLIEIACRALNEEDRLRKERQKMLAEKASRAGKLDDGTAGDGMRPKTLKDAVNSQFSELQGGRLVAAIKLAEKGQEAAPNAQNDSDLERDD